MKGKGLGKTIFNNIDLVSILNYNQNSVIELDESYGFTIDNDKLFGKGILVCYDGDLNDILEIYKLEPLYYSMSDGVLVRFILSNGIAAIRLTDIISFEDVSCLNYVNAFNSCFDLVYMRKKFDDLVDKDIFKNTILPPEPYYSLKSLFHGGVMVAKPGIYSNVHSYDLVSAHASNIVNELYPTGSYMHMYTSVDNLNKLRKNRAIFYIGNVTFKNLRLKKNFLPIIYFKDNVSMYEKGVELTESGYVVNAKELRIAITETYLDCINICYDYDEITEQYLFVCNQGGYLPDKVRNYVSSKFNDKNSKLKGTKEYSEAKMAVNLCFGFMCRATNDYNHYAYGHKLVYPYQWGVYTCLYTTYKIVCKMKEIVERGGKVIAIATDSIKYLGDFELDSGFGLGDLKNEGVFDKAYIVSVYRAIYQKEDNLEIKLAGCIKDAAEEFFNKSNIINIFQTYTEVPNGKVLYKFNNETSRFEAVYMPYTIGSV